MISLLLGGCVASEIEHNIELSSPVVVQEVIYFEDGGTTGIVLKDSAERIFKFCLDGRMDIVDFDEPKTRYIYINAIYPTDDGAKSIPVGEEQEKRILEILQEYISNNITEDERKKLLDIKTVTGYSQKEIDNFRILRVIETLKKRMTK
ncbi:MAG: hypothetical protein ABIK26_08545 [Candidatus Omnitrophota bacterium]